MGVVDSKEEKTKVRAGGVLRLTCMPDDDQCHAMLWLMLFTFCPLEPKWSWGEGVLMGNKKLKLRRLVHLSIFPMQYSIATSYGN